jgi:Fic/DOC family
MRNVKDPAKQLHAALLAEQKTSPRLGQTQSEPGLTLAQLQAVVPQLSRRSVQRQLYQWLDSQFIQAQGKGRARRFRLAPKLDAADVSKNNAQGNAQSKAAGMGAKPASALGDIVYANDTQDITAYLSQPPSKRTPVGYQFDFLDSYVPNVTFYLSDTLRTQLYHMGRTARTVQAAGTYSRSILNRLLIDLSWASSHLEGNTYSLLDTRALLDNGQAAMGKAAIETQMILNHKSAIELLVENAGGVGFDRFTLLNLHSALSENLLPNPADEGRLRQHTVDIGLSVYRPLGVPSQVADAFERMLAKCQAISDPFEQSFFIMVHLPYLQPFADINKRCSRLAANMPLFRANLCPLTFLGVPVADYTRAILGVYEMTRIELLRDLYVWAYERSTQEYLAIKQDIVQPDPLRLAWRDTIKSTVHSVVTQPEQNVLTVIDACLAAIEQPTQAAVRGLVLDEIKRLHEGVLARYGLRVGQLKDWQSVQKRTHA